MHTSSSLSQYDGGVAVCWKNTHSPQTFKDIEVDVILGQFIVDAEVGVGRREG
jgi:hypothetical protein